MTGSPPRNLQYNRAFAEGWLDEPIVQQLVAQVQWSPCIRRLDSREWTSRACTQP
jgi:hypothetical protein